MTIEDMRVAMAELPAHQQQFTVASNSDDVTATFTWPESKLIVVCAGTLDEGCGFGWMNEQDYRVFAVTADMIVSGAVARATIKHLEQVSAGRENP